MTYLRAVLYCTHREKLSTRGNLEVSRSHTVSNIVKMATSLGSSLQSSPYIGPDSLGSPLVKVSISTASSGVDRIVSPTQEMRGNERCFRTWPRIGIYGGMCLHPEQLMTCTKRIGGRIASVSSICDPKDLWDTATPKAPDNATEG